MKRRINAAIVICEQDYYYFLVRYLYVLVMVFLLGGKVGSQPAVHGIPFRIFTLCHSLKGPQIIA